MKILKYLGVASLALATVGCNDTEEIIQPGELQPDNTFIETSDLTEGIFGVYSGVGNTNEISFTAQFTDEVSIGRDNGGQGLNNDAVYLYNLNANTGFAQAIWYGDYGLINRANILLEGAAGIVPDPMDQAEIDEYDLAVAEAKALRAYAHANLLEWYAEDITNDNSLGIMVVDFVPPLGAEIPRSTVGDAVALIEQDLTDASVTFNRLGVIGSPAFVGIDFVEAVRGRLAIFREDYAAAETAADNILAFNNIASRSEFPGVWDDSNTAGIIFEAQRIAGDGSIGAIWNTNLSNSNGNPVFEMSRSVFNLLDNNTGDIRQSRYIDPTSTVDPGYATSPNPRNSDILIIDKYPGNPTLTTTAARNQTNDLKIFRTEEFLFIKAECEVFNGNLNAAASLMDQLRSQRLTSTTVPVYADAQEAWEDILEERRLELWLEGHRYLDFARLASKAGVNSYDRDEVDCSIANQTTVCDLPASDMKVNVFPIPQAELAANPGFPQNTGY
jgi:hypothetical protein